jgi:hypothetical protein
MMQSLRDIPEGLVVADLRIARGFDYCTGTVYEGVMVGHEKLGAVCSGGRYDDLVEGGGTKLPGVGASIGISRIVGRLFGQKLLRASRPTPTCVLIALPSDEARRAGLALARDLGARGINTELVHEPAGPDRRRNVDATGGRSRAHDPYERDACLTHERPPSAAARRADRRSLRSAPRMSGDPFRRPHAEVDENLLGGHILSLAVSGPISLAVPTPIT